VTDRLLLRLQVAVLASGTAFAWFTLVGDYRRFFSAGGRVFEFSGCLVANPLLTPCFYGALAFLGAFGWAVLVLRSAPERVAGRQRGLNWLLVAGTIFAWGNFSYELLRFSQRRPVPAFSCPPPGDTVVHPLLTPCFYGALVFLTAMVVSIFILRTRR
jgi:hypothetical protein